jgi:8-oxo-dGTP pyrophosphatase MutT (NUDIX family)
MSAGQRRLVQQIRDTLSRRERKVVADPALVCAAVLIPLRRIEGEWHVVVTQRSQSVGHHRGQVSFPGGACEPEDPDLQATAVRETNEEIGIGPAEIEILGALDDFETISSFVVTPFVGVLPDESTYSLNHSEVESIFQVPLSFLLDEANLRIETREHGGRSYEVLFWDYGGYTIWGATARMLKGFLELLSRPTPTV